MIAFLVFANWGKPLEGDRDLVAGIPAQWWIAGFFTCQLGGDAF